MYTHAQQLYDMCMHKINQLITGLPYFHKCIVKFRINWLQVGEYQALAQYLLVKDHVETGVYKMTMKESLRKV